MKAADLVPGGFRVYQDRLAMRLLAKVGVGAVALLQSTFLVLEMFYWNRPLGMRVFGTSPEFAAATRVLAANQGLYNGFLAAGLIWSLWAGGRRLAVFFLGCVLLAGIFGAITASLAILWVQALPAALALRLVLGSKDG